MSMAVMVECSKDVCFCFEYQTFSKLVTCTKVQERTGMCNVLSSVVLRKRLPQGPASLATICHLCLVSKKDLLYKNLHWNAHEWEKDNTYHDQKRIIPSCISSLSNCRWGGGRGAYCNSCTLLMLKRTCDYNLNIKICTLLSRCFIYLYIISCGTILVVRIEIHYSELMRLFHGQAFWLSKAL